MNALIFRRLVAQLNHNYLRIASSYTLNSCQTRYLLTSGKHVLDTERMINDLVRNEWQKSRTISTSQEIKLFPTKLEDSFLEQRRYKKGKKGGKREAREESSDEESDDEEKDKEEDFDLIDGKAIGFRDKNITIVSLRLDNVLKSGLNLARNRVEESFYNNLIRVNGQRVSKKSTEVSEDDEIDLIKGLNEENTDLLDVARVVIKKIEDKMSSKDRIQAKLRIFRSLTIENYPNDPYDGLAINLKSRDKEEER